MFLPDIPPLHFKQTQQPAGVTDPRINSLGADILDLPSRDLPQQDSSQGCVALHVFELVLEHGFGFRRPAFALERR
jgi:hypothetical protein